MYFSNKLFFLAVIFSLLSCDKDHEAIVPHATLRKIIYEVKGSQFRLNYIDSNSVFKKDQVYENLFRYEFKKGSGSSIGISAYKSGAADQVYSWNIYIDNKLYANALSEGGAYFTVPYE